MYTSFKSNSHNPKYQKDNNNVITTTTTKNTKYSEISHFSHKQHKLTFDYSESPFKCDGCKELGIGSRYKCSTCDFDLHTHCSIPSPSLFHPFYPKCSFHFLSKPPGDTPRYCNACEKPVRGFLYHCFSCGFDLHPCCAKLPTVLGSDDDKHGVRLFLYRKVSSACHRCGQKGRGWSYRSSCKRYNLHVACVREMVVESWHEGGGLMNIVESGCHHKGRGKGSRVRKCCEVAGMAVQVAVSAVLGDPTVLIAGIMGSLMSRT